MHPPPTTPYRFHPSPPNPPSCRVVSTTHSSNRFGINVECKGSTEGPRESRAFLTFSTPPPRISPFGKRIPLLRLCQGKIPSSSSFLARCESRRAKMEDRDTYTFTTRDKRMVRILKLQSFLPFFNSSLEESKSCKDGTRQDTIP